MNKLQDTFEQLKKDQRILAVFVLGLVAVVLWTTISLTASQKSTGIAPELQELAKPLVPSINQNIVEKIIEKKYYPAQELQNFPIYVLYNDDQTKTSTIIDTTAYYQIKAQEAETKKIQQNQQ